MTVIELPRAASTDGETAAMSRWDSEALWHEYLAGAERSYRRHGVAAAIDVDAIRRSNDTLFWSLLDAAGTVVGGVRAVGPLTSPDESHAVVEWAGRPYRTKMMWWDRRAFTSRFDQAPVWG